MDQLTDDVIIQIVVNIENLQDMVSIQLSCKRMYRLASHESIWKDRVSNEYMNSTQKPGIQLIIRTSDRKL